MQPIIVLVLYFLTGAVSGLGRRRKELPISDSIPSEQDGKPKASGRNFSSNCRKKIEFQRFLICPDGIFGQTEVAITELFSGVTSDYLDQAGKAAKSNAVN